MCRYLRSKPPATPLPKGTILANNDSNHYKDGEQYRRLIGKLLYLGMTRQNIAFNVQQLSQYVSPPPTNHWVVVVHLLKYLNGTMHTCIFFHVSNTLAILAYCDADWGTCRDTRKSITSLCVFLGDSLIS